MDDLHHSISLLTRNFAAALAKAVREAITGAVNQRDARAPSAPSAPFDAAPVARAVDPSAFPFGNPTPPRIPRTSFTTPAADPVAFPHGIPSAFRGPAAYRRPRAPASDASAFPFGNPNGSPNVPAARSPHALPPLYAQQAPHAPPYAPPGYGPEASAFPFGYAGPAPTDPRSAYGLAAPSAVDPAAFPFGNPYARTPSPPPYVPRQPRAAASDASAFPFANPQKSSSAYRQPRVTATDSSAFPFGHSNPNAARGQISTPQSNRRAASPEASTFPFGNGAARPLSSGDARRKPASMASIDASAFPFGHSSAASTPKSADQSPTESAPKKAAPKKAPARKTVSGKATSKAAHAGKASATVTPRISRDHAAILERATEALGAGPMFSEDLRSLFEDVPRSHYQAAMKQGVALGMVVKQGELRKTSYSLP